MLTMAVWYPRRFFVLFLRGTSDLVWRGGGKLPLQQRIAGRMDGQQSGRELYYRTKRREGPADFIECETLSASVRPPPPPPVVMASRRCHLSVSATMSPQVDGQCVAIPAGYIVMFDSSDSHVYCIHSQLDGSTGAQSGRWEAIASTVDLLVNSRRPISQPPQLVASY